MSLGNTKGTKGLSMKTKRSVENINFGMRSNHMNACYFPLDGSLAFFRS